MRYSISIHIMPWEIDYAMLTFVKLKEAFQYLDGDDEIIIHPVLNLSEDLIDWEKSQFTMNFFQQKFQAILPLLNDYTVKWQIYGAGNVGHLDLQRHIKVDDADFYMSICPDINFHPALLFTMIWSSKQIKNDYFVIVPEISQLWDHTWDEITNERLKGHKYEEWDTVDSFEVVESAVGVEGLVEPVQRNKWAGWFDLYSKGFYEDLAPIHDDWENYGPYDWYSMMLCEEFKKRGVDFQQYVIREQVVFPYNTGGFKDRGFDLYYKALLSINKPKDDQRKIFEVNMQKYLEKGIKMFEEKGKFNNE